MTPTKPADPTLALLALPEFRALLTARGLAALGMTAIATVVAFQTYEVTGEPLALGLLGLVEAIPALALMLLGGHVADLRDRRSIILLTGSLLSMGTLALSLMSLDPAGASFVGILAVVFLIGVAAGFERPALVAFEAQVIPIEHASRGASLTSATWTASAIVGPAVGGLAIALVGIPVTYLVLTVLMAISVLAITRIGRKPMPPPDRSERVLHSLASGVRYVAGHKVLLGVDGTGPVRRLLRRCHRAAAGVRRRHPGRRPHRPGAAAHGTLGRSAALHAGHHADAAAAARRRSLLLGFVALFGVSMVVFGLSTSFVLSLVALFVAGLADGVSVVIRLVVLRVESPEAMRGRIASVNHLFIGASNELGAFESGVAATLLGVVPSVVAGGVLTLLVVGAVTLLVPDLRRLDLGRRLVEGPGAQPMAAPSVGSNIAAAEVDPGLESVLDTIDRRTEALPAVEVTPGTET